MKKEKYSFEFDRFEDKNELETEQKKVVEQALEISHHAYAPYSNFKVGAAVQLANGEIFSSSNQENASYPVGTCAERGLLAYVNANYPNIKIEKLAVSTPNVNYPLPPCGMCRQYILEIEKKQEQSIEVILSGNEGEVFVLNSARDLLPLHFTDDFLG
ncbi:cytidine deaminase [Empedobacter brevis]|uniref:Cytidine deaminase n=2 Tax=Empedobacter brevis TaxID=247 RepID=A0A511NLF3_9FLAO|nr:cytidine deaminase [Empedobacter brevis]MDM1073173.1 cytidine deaminase [Empedobacter brevis]QES91519.1 cytidine deaminase [Empedobacter brevis]QHC83298.1 cytidine deaminase [Empedobacter brevis]GEM53632.1 cytidine deaminase [Empedobacter brevis NBRC 14943 = ATCC 43319]